jgi:hypothetical protein
MWMVPEAKSELQKVSWSGQMRAQHSATRLALQTAQHSATRLALQTAQLKVQPRAWHSGVWWEVMMSAQWSWAQLLVLLSGIEWEQWLEALLGHWTDAVLVESSVSMSVVLSESPFRLMSGYLTGQLDYLSEDLLVPTLEFPWELLWELVSLLLV